jgi:hypothetical protein
VNLLVHSSGEDTTVELNTRYFAAKAGIKTALQFDHQAKVAIGLLSAIKEYQRWLRLMK